MTPPAIARRAWELIRAHPVIFAVLVLWTAAPLVALIAYVGAHGGVLTGAYGTDAFDQLAYLAWIRDEASHVLASNLWQVTPSAHDYLHPMYVISGLLWQLGASIQLSYLVWTPVGVLVLFLGIALYAHHMLPGSRREQAAALLLGLFYVTPVLAVAVWTGHLTTVHRDDLVFVTDDAFAALQTWGFAHTAITIGLMPVFLIAAERRLQAKAEGRPGWGASVIGGLAGLLVAWLHPWQALILLAALAGLVIVRGPRRRYLALIPMVVATVLPLLYGQILARYDPVWHAFQQRTIGGGTAPWWALLAAFGPIAAVGAAGVRRPREDREWLLVLWVAANAAVYFLVPEFPPHALTGVTVPLAVLAVHGWRHLRARVPRRVPRRVLLAAALAAILAFTVPDAAYHAQSLRDDFGNTIADAATRQLLVLSPGQAAALSFVARSPRGGPVLAPWFLSMSVPAMTGHEAYAGHLMWQPGTNIERAGIFFSPTLRDPTGALRRAILRDSRAQFVVADCSSPPVIAHAIAPMVLTVRRFGCEAVFETR